MFILGFLKDKATLLNRKDLFENKINTKTSCFYLLSVYPTKQAYVKTRQTTSQQHGKGIIKRHKFKPIDNKRSNVQSRHQIIGLYCNLKFHSFKIFAPNFPSKMLLLTMQSFL